MTGFEIREFPEVLGQAVSPQGGERFEKASQTAREISLGLDRWENRHAGHQAQGGWVVSQPGPGNPGSVFRVLP